MKISKCKKMQDKLMNLDIYITFRTLIIDYIYWITKYFENHSSEKVTFKTWPNATSRKCHLCPRVISCFQTESGKKKSDSCFVSWSHDRRGKGSWNHFLFPLYVCFLFHWSILDPCRGKKNGQLCLLFHSRAFWDNQSTSSSVFHHSFQSPRTNKPIRKQGYE